MEDNVKKYSDIEKYTGSIETDVQDDIVLMVKRTGSKWEMIGVSKKPTTEELETILADSLKTKNSELSNSSLNLMGAMFGSMMDVETELDTVIYFLPMTSNITMLSIKPEFK